MRITHRNFDEYDYGEVIDHLAFTLQLYDRNPDSSVRDENTRIWLEMGFDRLTELRKLHGVKYGV